MSEPTPHQQVTQAIKDYEARTLQLIEEVRQRLLVQLGSASAFGAERLADLLRTIDEAVIRFKDQFNQLLLQGTTELAALGSTIVASTLQQAEIVAVIPTVTVELLSTLGTTTLDLVTKIGDNLRRDLSVEVQLGVLGVKAPSDVINAIDQLLDAEGVNGYAARAETITRTEVGRAQSEASQASMETAVRQGARIQKQWLHSSVRNPRSAHVAASGQTRDVNESFIVNGVALRYPRDPQGPAAETINCRCVAVPIIR